MCANNLLTFAATSRMFVPGAHPEHTMTAFMRNSDAFTWAMESDPRLRSTVVSVVLLERSPDWDEVRERFDLISRKLPMFRQRVVSSRPCPRYSVRKI